MKRRNRRNAVNAWRRHIMRGAACRHGIIISFIGRFREAGDITFYLARRSQPSLQPLMPILRRCRSMAADDIGLVSIIARRYRANVA